MTKAVFALLVFCVVYVNCDDYGHNRMPEYVRIKRAKYYSSPPMRFYRRPPIAYPVKGIFSYTPPPNYMEHDDPYPGNFKPKVSKRPTNDGLADEDLNNIVKHLSKQDLDKIIEFAGGKYGGPSFEKQSPTFSKPPIDDVDDVNTYKSVVQELNADQKFLLNGPYENNARPQPNRDMDYKENSRPPTNNHAFEFSEPDNIPFRGPLANAYNGASSPFNFAQNEPAKSYQNSPPIPNSPQDLNEVPLYTEESMHSNQFSAVHSHIQQEFSVEGSQKTESTFGSEPWKEEQMPKPLNLREDPEYQLSSSNNVPTVVKSDSYKVESFGNLPLMEYDAKRDSVSSYHVPHYTVVSPSNPSPPVPSYAAPHSSPLYGAPQSSSLSSYKLTSSPAAAAVKAPKIEPAPPKSVAKEQSDAHLKATKIWTHKSRGAAYTLHDDGTLSVERPKPVYGQ